MNPLYFALFLFCSFASSTLAQDLPALRALVEEYEGRAAFERAYSVLKEKRAVFGQASPADDAWALYHIGFCLYRLGRYEEAESFFQAYLRKEKNPKADSFWFLARALHLQSRYSEAAWYYKYYLRFLEKNAPQRNSIKLLLRQCGQRGRAALPVKASVLPLSSLNSSAQEWNLLASPRFSGLFYFSSNRANTALGPVGGGLDIYQTELASTGLWTEARPLSTRYNSPEDELLAAFSPEGYEAVFWRGSRSLIDNWDSLNTQGFARPWLWQSLDSSVLAKDPQYWSDELLLFSAYGPNSEGGRDLYYCRRDAQGLWSAPKNMGSEINSPYDEETPFLASNGRELYFSSLRPEGFGGYDVYRSVFLDSCLCWSPPALLAEPINSAGDEFFFRLDSSGRLAYLSSERLGGQGGMDLYQVLFSEPLALPGPALSFLDTWLEGDIRPQHPDSLAKARALAARSPYYKYMPAQSNPKQPQRQLLLKPYYYHKLAQEDWRREFARRMQRYAPFLQAAQGDLRLGISIHGTGKASEELALLNSFLLTLRSASIEPAHWRIRLLGASQRLMLDVFPDGSSNSEAEAMNKRVDFELFGSFPDSNTQIRRGEASVSPQLCDSLALQRRQLEEVAPLFALRLGYQAYAQGGQEQKAWIDLMRQWHIEQSEGQLSLLLGLEPALAAVESLAEQAKALGLEASIVPYYRGWPLRGKALQALAEEYRELERFVEKYGE